MEREAQDMNPGGQEAVARGCSCPVHSNWNGKGADWVRLSDEPDPDFFWVHADCLVHRGWKPPHGVEILPVRHVFGEWWIDEKTSDEIVYVCHRRQFYYVPMDQCLHTVSDVRGGRPDSIEGWVEHIRRKNWCDEVGSLRDALCLGMNLQRTLPGAMARIREETALEPGIPCVYFVSDGDAIKIGFTSNGVDRRLEALRNGNPREIKVLATMRGTMDDEKRLHRRFAEYRVRGEWFKAAPELLDFIASLGD